MVVHDGGMPIPPLADALVYGWVRKATDSLSLRTIGSRSHRHGPLGERSTARRSSTRLGLELDQIRAWKARTVAAGEQPHRFARMSRRPPVRGPAVATAFRATAPLARGRPGGSSGGGRRRGEVRSPATRRRIASPFIDVRPRRRPSAMCIRTQASGLLCMKPNRSGMNRAQAELDSSHRPIQGKRRRYRIVATG
jgi:hypothetical protein